jgi:hypothetical protein
MSAEPLGRSPRHNSFHIYYFHIVKEYCQMHTEPAGKEVIRDQPARNWGIQTGEFCGSKAGPGHLGPPSP